MTQEARPFTVTELTRRIKHLLEQGFPVVALTGELSNVRPHSSGHTYLTLKDENAQISAVIWRSRIAMVPLVPEDGMRVVLTGRITVYEARGTYQFEVYTMRLQGIGELQKLFEDLKRKLSAEGLFDETHKKAIPGYPERIGVITSPTGAALHDLLNVISRRFPVVEVVLIPVRVQGGGAAREIASAIAACNTWGGADVLILARGGGSIEDLWAFNEEIVARAIYASKIPVISAVGHEIDFTIADFVADRRAPTPSAAGEIVVPDGRALLEKLRKSWYILHESTQQMLDRHRDTIRHLLRSHPFLRPLDLLRQVSQRVDDLERILVSTMNHRVEMWRSSVTSSASHLSAFDPKLVLRRGYSLVMKEGKLVSRAESLETGQRVSIRFYDGDINSRVE